MSATPTSRAKRLPFAFLLAGCAVIVICGSALLAGALGWLRQRGAEAAQPAVEYILDTSPRMALPSEQGGASRLEVASSVLAEVIQPAGPSLVAGLRVFGDGHRAVACEDTKLVVPLAPANRATIVGQLPHLQTGPSTQAALVQAIIAAIGDVTTETGPRTIVVVTGGDDTCSAEAAQLMAAEAEQAQVDLHLFVIGYLVEPPAAEALRGLVEAWGNGTYLEAANEAELREALRAVQGHVDDPDTTTPGDVSATATAASQPANTATPETATVDSPTPGPTATTTTGSDAAAACDHPYFPLRLGATWTYATADGSHTYAVTAVSGTAEKATATMTRDGVDEITWQCTADGLVVFTALGGILGFGPQPLDWTVLERTGAWLPPSASLAEGARWQFGFGMEEAPASGETVVGGFTFVQDLEVAGSEPFTLEGEVMDALRIDSSLVTTPRDLPPASGRDTYWLVEGLGLVKVEQWREFTVGPATVTYSLTDYDIP